MSKRELVINAFNNQKVERVPVGFWFHFVQGEEFTKGLTSEEVVRKNIEGHQKFYDSFQPDFLKLMSDGFFGYPNREAIEAENAEDLKKIKPIGPNHPWIEKQVELVKELTKRFGSEVATFYNIFAPTTFLELIRDEGKKTIAELFHEDPKALAYAVGIIAEDIKVLARRVIEEGGADGIYLSVKNIQDNGITKEDYLTTITPSEIKVLEEANLVSENNILHICGYEGARNDLTIYMDYPAKIVNWAVTVEKISLQEGKQLFDGKAVIGGFDNQFGSLLHSGTREEIEAYTEKLLSESGTTGIILGADCTVPSDIKIERLDWVRQKAEKQSKKKAETIA